MNHQETISKYNKLHAHNRGRYLPWSEQERREMKEAGLIQQFTLRKNALEAEIQVIERVKIIAGKLRANRFILSANDIQIHASHFEAHKSSMYMPTVYEHFSTRSHVYSSLHLLNIRCCSSVGEFLIAGTSHNGLYELIDGEWKITRTANKIIKRLYDLGYVSKSGRTPLACNPLEFSKLDIDEAVDLVNFCTLKDYKSISVKRFLKFLTSRVKLYRWPEKAKLINQINQHTKETR